MICTLRQIDAAEIDNLLAHPEHVGAVLDGVEAGQGGEIDLDKAWHGIHFLLTGSAWEGDEPLGYLIAAGQPVGDEDVGYGPARVLRPKEVAQLDAALAAISLDNFRLLVSQPVPT
jgi:hypothetical protein